MEETERKAIFANTYVPSAETYRQMYRRIRMAMTWFTAILFGAAAIFAVVLVVFVERKKKRTA